MFRFLTTVAIGLLLCGHSWAQSGFQSSTNQHNQPTPATKQYGQPTPAQGFHQSPQATPGQQNWNQRWQTQNGNQNQSQAELGQGFSGNNWQNGNQNFQVNPANQNQSGQFEGQFPSNGPFQNQGSFQTQFGNNSGRTVAPNSQSSSGQFNQSSNKGGTTGFSESQNPTSTPTPIANGAATGQGNVSNGKTYQSFSNGYRYYSAPRNRGWRRGFRFWGR